MVSDLDVARNWIRHAREEGLLDGLRLAAKLQCGDCGKGDPRCGQDYERYYEGFDRFVNAEIDLGGMTLVVKVPALAAWCGPIWVHADYLCHGKACSHTRKLRTLKEKRRTEEVLGRQERGK